MIADRIVQNKYKLIAAIIIVLIAVDGYMHKGLVKVMLPKNYPSFNIITPSPKNNNQLINPNKNWIKAVNSIKRIDGINANSTGIECDIYFDTAKNIFDVYHDVSTGLDFETLLNEYRKLNLQASIWIDFKNLNDATVMPALEKLVKLRTEYHLTNKVLVESDRVDVLQQFSDSGFYTSYYAPMFNPYLINNDSLKYWVDSIAAVVKRSSVNALSGYYFQYTFLHHYFPGYDILLWAPNDKFSLINWLFKRKINNAKEIFIALYN